MKNQVSISVVEFANVLAKIKGCKFVSVEYTTTPKIPNKKRKTGQINPFLGCEVTKVTKANLQYNLSYSNAVNNRLEKSGSDVIYEVAPMKGFSWLVENKTLISNNTNETALRLYCAKNCKIESIYMLDGVPMTDEQATALKLYLGDADKCCKKQSDAGLSEEEQVKPMNIYIKNVQSFKVDGTEYIIK